VETFFTLYGVRALKLRPDNAAFLLSFLALMFVLFAVPSGYIAGKVGRRKTILTGIASLAILLALVRVMPFELQTSGVLLPILLALIRISWSLINVNSLAMVVDVAPQTELGTYTGLYYFFPTAAAVIRPILAGYLIEALGGDYGMIFVLAPITLVFAFVFMFAVRRGERADHAGATVSVK